MLIEPVTSIDADTSVVILCGPTLMHLWSQPDAQMPTSYIDHNLTLQLQQRAGRLLRFSAVSAIADAFAKNFGYRATFHLLIPKKTKNRYGESVRYHTYSRNLPVYSLVGRLKLAVPFPCNILVPSPEFCLCHFAKSATTFETVDYANELCGRFGVNLASSHGMNARRPVSTTRRISRFINDENEGIDGRRTTAKAVKYICESTRSPLESRFAMFLKMPLRQYGGMGFGQLVANEQIRLYGAAKRVFGKDSCEPDFQLWPTSAIIELDSDEFHLNESAATQDRRKANALSLIDRPTLRVDQRQFATFHKFNSMCNAIRNVAGLPPENLNDDEMAKRRLMHEYLLRGMRPNLRF